MRDVVKKHEPDVNRILKSTTLRHAWGLIQAIAIATRIEGKKDAQHQPQRGSARDDQQPARMRGDDLA